MEHTIQPGNLGDYVEQRNGGYYVAGTRISLDSVVYAFLNGESPEEIARSFPILTLEKVYAAITFYLANRAAIDAYLREGELEFEKLRQESRRKHPQLYAKLDAAREASQVSRQ
jgi:uncharacterized protein (DUF433 family)